MKSLKQRIAGLIGGQGPLPVAEYMALCLSDEEHGYYMSRQPFGRGGDFTTAPEVSQMFGELIGVWLVEMWRRFGRPDRPVFAEIGPGRGTLARDIARTFDRLEPKLVGNSDFYLIETSPRLSAEQAATLKDIGGTFIWAKSLDALPQDRPLFIVGNELFDAIPARQFVRTPEGWRERCVGLDNSGTLRFVSGAAMIDPALLPAEAAAAPHGSIFEIAPAREALMQQIAERIARDSGAALFLDYGHLASAIGDTFQAMRGHAYVDPLAEPGEADLTSHVDFAALATVVRASGIAPRLTTQGDFLVALGLLERAGQLGANRGAEAQQSIRDDVQRLAGPDAMGELFKVIAFSSPAHAMPGFPPDG